MELMNPNLAEILPQAKNILKDAGHVLVDYQHKLSSLDISAKADGSLVSTADFAANELIIAGLKRLTPTAHIISEESDQDHKLSGHEGQTWSWILDPLDGTKVFLEGKNTFSIQLALYFDQQYQLGLSYFPAQEILLWAARGGGAFLGDLRLSVSENSILQTGRIYGRGAPEVITQYCLNSASAEGHIDSGDAFKRLSQGALDGIYIAPNVLSIWDVAASHVIVTEAGGASNISEIGEPFNVSSPISSPIIMGNKAIYQELKKL